MNGSRRILTLGGAGLLGVIAMTFAAASCGGSSTATSGDGGAAGSTGTAGASATAGTSGTAGTAGGDTTGPTGCNAAVSAYCTRLFACTDPAGTAADMANCVRLTGVGVGCGRATTQDFKDCIGDYRSSSCATLFNADGSSNSIASCAGQFGTIPPSAAETQCNQLAVALCEKQAMCEGPMTSDDMLTCEQNTALNDIGCPIVTAIGPTFNQCITDIGAAPCAALEADAGTAADGGGPVPSCDNALTFAQ